MTRNEMTEMLLGREIEINFVSIREAIALHDESIDRVGGTAGVRDATLLESALHKPMQACLYSDESDLYRLAGILADGITQNHAFLDGNKRTAFLCACAFLAKNGITFEPDTAEAVRRFRDLARHEENAESIAEWIEVTTKYPGSQERGEKAKETGHEPGQ